MMKSLIVFLSVLVMSTFSTSLVYAVDMGEIKSAETRSGGIANQSQTDSFTFNGNIGQTIDISMSRQSGSVNPQIDLFDPSGILETSATCGDTAFCVATTIGNYKLLQSGLYTIVVRDKAMNGTGNYSLSLLLIPGPTVSPQDPEGGGILSGETKLGGITPNADTDSYTFNGNIGQTIDISMSRQSGSVNPQIDLFDPSGILETSATCGDTAFCVATTIGNYKPLQSGLYTIVVRDNAMNGTGNYSLSLTKIPAFQVSPSILLSLNQAVFVTSDTLIVSARVRNGSDPVNVEAKTWISLPAGVLEVTILDSHLTFTVAANADVTADIFTYTFDGSEPSGNYNVGSRFLNIMSGRELSVNVQTFSFSP